MDENVTMLKNTVHHYFFRLSRIYAIIAIKNDFVIHKHSLCPTVFSTPLGTEWKMSLCVRKPTICMGENKDADQLRGNREADQRLCFRYTDSTFPPLLIPKFSSSWVSSVTVQAGLCWTWSETQIVGFLMHRLKSYLIPLL